MGDWFDEGGNGAVVDVHALLDGGGMDGLLRMVQGGALISFSLTRDGGALGVTVTVDGRYKRSYFRDSEELGSWAEEAIPPVLDALEAVAASRGQGNRQRRSKTL